MESSDNPPGDDRDFNPAVPLEIDPEIASRADDRLREFAEDGGLETALVVDRSGALVAGVSEAEVTVEVISALVAGASGAMRALVRELGEGGGIESFHQGRERVVYLRDLMDRFVLVGVAPSSVPVGIVREKGDQVSEGLSALLAGVPASEPRPVESEPRSREFHPLAGERASEAPPESSIFDAPAETDPAAPFEPDPDIRDEGEAAQYAAVDESATPEEPSAEESGAEGVDVPDAKIAEMPELDGLEAVEAEALETVEPEALEMPEPESEEPPELEPTESLEFEGGEKSDPRVEGLPPLPAIDAGDRGDVPGETAPPETAEALESASDSAEVGEESASPREPREVIEPLEFGEPEIVIEETAAPSEPDTDEVAPDTEPGSEEPPPPLPAANGEPVESIFELEEEPEFEEGEEVSEGLSLDPGAGRTAPPEPESAAPWESALAGEATGAFEPDEVDDVGVFELDGEEEEGEDSRAPVESEEDVEEVPSSGPYYF